MSSLVKEFGSYRIMEELGAGEMGTVYLARDPESRQLVVLKVIRIRPNMKDVVEAAQRGAKLQKELALIDPRVAKIIEDNGVRDGYFFIVMEYVDGSDLAGPQPVGEAVNNVIEVCKMLETAHNWRGYVDGKEQQGIVHGDIKPSNVRKSLRGEIKVLDFQISKSLSQSRRRTRSNFASTAYSSPEYLKDYHIDFHSDLWAVGVLLYEVLTGGLPFEGDTTAQMEAAIQSGSLPPWPNNLPAALKDIVYKILAPRPEDRYQSAAKMRIDLEAFLRSWQKQSDSKATHRSTAPPQGSQPEDTYRTHRTYAPPLEPTPPTDASGPAIKVDPATVGATRARPASGLRLRRIVPYTVGVVMALVLLSVGYIGYLEFSYWREAERLRQGITSTNQDSLEQAWDSYQQLDKKVLLSRTLRGLRQALRQGMLDAADVVINDYRNSGDSSNPVVRLDHWKYAESYLERALKLDIADDFTKAKLHYCQGHLQRIDGEDPVRVKTDPATTRRLLNEALSHFSDALSLKQDWPDPYVGMARIYAFDQADVVKSAEALRQAEQLGYRMGKREKAIAAFNYRVSASKALQEAKRLRGESGEEELLKQAENDYLQALDILQSISPFGHTAQEINTVSGKIELIRQRLSELHPDMPTSDQ